MGFHREAQKMGNQYYWKEKKYTKLDKSIVSLICVLHQEKETITPLTDFRKYINAAKVDHEID